MILMVQTMVSCKFSLKLIHWNSLIWMNAIVAWCPLLFTIMSQWRGDVRSRYVTMFAQMGKDPLACRFPKWIPHWKHHSYRRLIAHPIPLMSMAIPGSDLLEVPTIYKAGLCKGISPQNMAKHMVQYLHFRILEFPLIMLNASWSSWMIPYTSAESPRTSTKVSRACLILGSL